MSNPIFVNTKLSRVFAAITTLVVGPAAGAGIWDDPTNLKVLPETTTPKQLGESMREYSFATGARCETCHVGEAGKPLETFDFASDEKPEKLTARIMMRMVSDINARLSDQLDKDTASIVEVRCVTCHRGQSRPRMLTDVIGEIFAEEGLDASIEKYRSLREDYYGSHTYDFSEWPMLEFAEGIAKQGETAAALSFLAVNLETNPKSASTHTLRGRILQHSGDKAGARESYEAALQIQPGDPFVMQQLEKLPPQ